LNIGLFRPIFSPTDFIQIKGRGTRTHDFTEELFDEEHKSTLGKVEKAAYKLFDFFANVEYFEEEYDYDEVIDLPRPSSEPRTGPVVPVRRKGNYDHADEDYLASIKVEEIGPEGMRIDRMFFERFGDTVRANPVVADRVASGQWDQVIDYVQREVLNRPDEFFTLEKLRKAVSVDRRLSLREILENVFGFITGFKSKDELLEEEFAKFVADCKPEEAQAIPALKEFFKAYATSDQIRHIIDSKHYTDLATNAAFSTRDLKAVPEKYRDLIPSYIKDYVSLNQFTV
jgi:type I restriction enzyme R subunit